MRGLLRVMAVNILMGASLLYMLEVNKLTYLMMIFIYFLADLALIGWLEKKNR